MDAAEFKSILENNDCNVRSYSGRGMYGKECIGFTVDQDTNLLGLVAEIVASVSDLDESVQDGLVTAFNRVRTDNMGLGTIVYFPSIPWSGGAEE